MLSDSNLASRFLSLLSISQTLQECAGYVLENCQQYLRNREATTRSGPEDKNIGAATNGNFNRVSSALMFNFFADIKPP